MVNWHLGQCICLSRNVTFQCNISQNTSISLPCFYDDTISINNWSKCPYWDAQLRVSEDSLFYGKISFREIIAKETKQNFISATVRQDIYVSCSANIPSSDDWRHWQKYTYFIKTRNYVDISYINVAKATRMACCVHDSENILFFILLMMNE